MSAVWIDNAGWPTTDPQGDEATAFLAAMGFESLVTLDPTTRWVASYPLGGDETSQGVTRSDDDVDDDGEPVWLICSALDGEVDETCYYYGLVAAVREAARRNAGGAQ